MTQLSLVGDPSRGDDVLDLDPLRAVTLTQPWCGLMAAGIKLIENRNRPMIKRDHIGKLIALHASREIDEGVYKRIEEIAPSLFVRRYFGEAGDSEDFTDSEWYRLSRITGAIIAVAELADIIAIPRGEDVTDPALNREFHAALRRGTVAEGQRRWYFQRVGYVLRNVRPIRKPPAIRGFQGFWTVRADVAADVRAQLKAAA